MNHKFRKINILSIISILFLIGFIYIIADINILPNSYLFSIIFVFVVIQIVGVLFVNLRVRLLFVLGILVLSLSIIINSTGIYYLYYTNNFLNKSFSSNLISDTTKFYIVTSGKFKYNNKDDITGNVSYYVNQNSIDKALERAKEEIKANFNSSNDLVSMFYDLNDKKIDFVLIDKGSYDIIFDLNKGINKEDYRIIYEFDIDEEVSMDRSNKLGDFFNIYIGGIDFTNKLVDFNMIISINTKTREILLTSIPRDYYIEVYGKEGRRDTLSFMGSYGITNNIKSLEKFFDIELNYYMKIKGESLVEIVDAVGGINYCSDSSFTTTHSTVLNTYDDSKGKRLYIKRGCQELNGIEALTVARERKAFVGGDRVRQENCMRIMLSIFDKFKSTNTIANYNNILTSLSNLYETTIPKSIVTDIVKDIINGNDYNIISQSVNGTSSYDFVYLTTLKSYVMEPDMETVKLAQEKIKNLQRY